MNSNAGPRTSGDDSTSTSGLSMLSATAAYAIRAMIHLAGREGSGPVRVDDVADALEVPKNYLSKVLHALVKEGVLQSSRGPHGGFELAVPSSELTLFQVVVPFDDIEARRQCVLGQGECSDENPCALHWRWSGVAADMAAFFRETALAEVVEDRDGDGDGDRDRDRERERESRVSTMGEE